MTLAALAFDHRRGDPLSPTLPLRSGPVLQPVPEWTAFSPAGSSVAYVLDRVGRGVTVLARFSATGPTATVVEIRAVADADAGPGPRLPGLGPVTVRFGPAGDSGWCEIPLDPGPLGIAGTGAGRCRWTWQVRTPATPGWTTIAETVHRVYVVPSEPTAPWTTDPQEAGRAIPSVAALDVACAWAAGATDSVDAAARVTDAVNGLGGRAVTYDVLLGAPHYCSLGLPQFFLDAFLDRLAGGPGAGPLVNCTDCAAIVSTFANLLGADLWQSKMGLVGAGFSINPLVIIGSTTWSRLWGGFVFHEVAWTGECGEDDRIYDACLRADADAHPARAPRWPFVPADLVFGTPGGYRDRVASTVGRATCVPNPGTRERRAITGAPVVSLRAFDDAVEASTAGRLGMDQAWSDADDRYFIDGFAWFGSELPDWSLERWEILAETPVVALVSWWRRKAGAGHLRIDSFEAPSAGEARRILLQLSAEIPCPDLAPLEPGYLGDVALVAPDGVLVLFQRGNHVHAVRGVDVDAADVVPDAQRLDRWLVRGGRTVGTMPAEGRSRAGPLRTATWQRLVADDARVRRQGGDLVVEPRSASWSVQCAVVTPRDVGGSDAASITAAASTWSR